MSPNRPIVALQSQSRQTLRQPGLDTIVALSRTSIERDSSPRIRRSIAFPKLRLDQVVWFDYVYPADSAN